MASSRAVFPPSNPSYDTYDSAGGQDYSSLLTWESATDVNLVSTTTSYVLRVYAGSHNDAAELDGATTNSSYFRRVEAAAGEGHSGIPLLDGSVAAFVRTVGSRVFSLKEDNSQIHDLVLKTTGFTGNGGEAVRMFGARTVCVGCIVLEVGEGDNKTTHSWDAETGANNKYIINCASIQAERRAFKLRAGTLYLYNFTEYDSVSASACDVGATLNSKNCIFDLTVNDNGTHNQTTNTTSNPTYVNAGSNDCHLDPSDTVALDNGTDLSADANFAFDDDIDGDTITGDWSIGFDSIVSADIEISIVQGIAITESISLDKDLEELLINIFEQIGLIETIITAMPLGDISVAEGIGATESIGPDVPLGDLSNFENLGVAEFLSLLKDIVPSVFENIGLTEFIQLLKDANINLFESIGLQEFIQAASELAGVDVSDSIGLNEFIQSITELAGVAGAEDIGIAELIQTAMELAGIDQVQNIGIAEVITAAIEGLLGTISETQRIAVIEAITLELESVIGAISNFDIIGLSESIQMFLEGAGISNFDSIGIAETIVGAMEVKLTISDLVAITEYILVELQVEAEINLFDTIALTEVIQAAFDNLLLQRVESIGLSEFINVVISGIVGKVTAEFSFTRPGVGFDFKKPKADFTLN